MLIDSCLYSVTPYGEIVQPEATVFASETEQEMKAWL
ncbi:hypothetical protein Lepto7376_2494 [[Leptolyngbya] sp. PCC 7376]|nr:hypothetical protein Lepto7376_2494 [[Leptolyngbya] sp. PCC 7376]